MARFIVTNAAGEVTGTRDGKTAPPDSSEEKFVKYTHADDSARWGNFWGERDRNGLRWISGTYRYKYNTTTRAPELVADDTNDIRVVLAERKSEKASVFVVVFRYRGTTGAKVDGYTGVHYANLQREGGEVIPVRMVFVDGVARLREVLDPGRYTVTPATDPDNPDATPYKMSGDTDFAIYLTATITPV